MQSLQRIEDKLKAVTKENIEMVSIEEKIAYYCMISVCSGGNVCMVSAYVCVLQWTRYSDG